MNYQGYLLVFDIICMLTLVGVGFYGLIMGCKKP